MAKRFHFAFLDRFEAQFQKIKTLFSHVGLYLGLILYTALGAWIFILIEHPVERDKLETIQHLLITERENFLIMIYNLTSHIEIPPRPEDLMGGGGTGLLGGPDPNLYSPETIKSMMLATNSLRPQWDSQEYYHLENLVKRVDAALLDYEQTVAVAAEEGINVTSKQANFQWTYVQSVFFASTIITTVGYGNIAPVTLGGRLFCILFAMVGIPFTLSVIADVGQISATLISAFWAKAKPVLMPMIDRISDLVKRTQKKHRSLKEKGGVGGESGVGGDGDDDSSGDGDDDDDDPMNSMGITANIIMAVVGFFLLGLFLSTGSWMFTHYEDWSFFDAFYFCFITVTTIGFGDIVPNIASDSAPYMLLCMIYILVGLAFTSTIIELVRRQYAESWRKMQELRAQIQAQLKLADHLRKMAEQGKDLEGMDVDLDELRRNLEKFKKGRFGKFFGDFNLDDLDWINKRKVKAVTIFFYETSV